MFVEKIIHSLIDLVWYVFIGHTLDPIENYIFYAATIAAALAIFLFGVMNAITSKRKIMGIIINLIMVLIGLVGLITSPTIFISEQLIIIHLFAYVLFYGLIMHGMSCILAGHKPITNEMFENFVLKALKINLSKRKTPFNRR